MAITKSLLESALNSFNYPIGIYKAVRDSEGNPVDFTIEFVNDALCRDFHLSQEEQLGKRLYREVMPHHDKRVQAAQLEVLESGEPISMEITTPVDPVTGGEGFAVYRVHIAKCNDGIVASGQDITKEKELDLRAIEEAEKDDLTGLLSPASFYAKLEKAVSDSRRYGSHFSVVIIDLDNFKKVNDRLGHLYGNQVLQKVAGAIGERIRESDAAGRFGGDEFVLLLSQAGGGEAKAVANQIRRSIGSIQIEEDRRIRLSASAGICFVDKFSNTDPDEALRRADQMLYRAKAEGGNRSILREPDS